MPPLKLNEKRHGGMTGADVLVLRDLLLSDVGILRIPAGPPGAGYVRILR